MSSPWNECLSKLALDTPIFPVQFLPPRPSPIRGLLPAPTVNCNDLNCDVCAYLPAAAHVPHIHSSYLRKFLEPDKLKDHIRMACVALSDWDFDAIAFRGMSGALIAPPVALALGKTLIMVRKPDEDSHAIRWSIPKENHLVEGDAGARTYIIVDDFISSGRTKEAIIEAVKNFAPHARCLGLLEAERLTDLKLAYARGTRYPLS